MIDTDLVRRLMAVSNQIWNHSRSWDAQAQRTLGEQLVRAADSIGANLVEGDGRGSQPDALRFFRIARASLRETEYWLVLAGQRSLITPNELAEILNELEQLSKMLSAFVSYRERTRRDGIVREEAATYDASSPPE